MATAILTAQRLRELHAYNPDTGVFTRLQSRGGYLAGAESGTTNTIGYRVIRIDKVDYYAHRLAFLFMTGEIPAIVDHINGNRSDNRFINLRPSSKKLNAQNIRGATSRNGLGILGAYIGQNGRFASRIRIDGRNKFLGEFATPELAHKAYLEAKRKHHDANTL